MTHAYTYACPHCPLTIPQPRPARLGHHCPHNRNRFTDFVEVTKETTA